ncbi:Tex family protein [Bacteroides sp. OF04-15BH]|uniref:Tex family protein n=1 Tax=Bacteroides sp. OF04-15BH TaxID=2292281 RepID=UPI000E4E8C21|nr:Tex family protein [Bacteroides sp. OF04-15BH]RHP63292.1 RNA-binding transcriptional accessory protein [Bacteroides sp. OF04-15BH]
METTNNLPIFGKLISENLSLTARQVCNTLELLDSGATVPFISRYRKERTGSLDEVQIAAIQEQYDKLKTISKRKETIRTTIEEQGKLTPELQERIEQCWDANLLEDLYLPYKPKKRTKAEIARQKGLEPLALKIMMQRGCNLDAEAQKFVRGEVKDKEEALAGARDIIAEQVSENEEARKRVRRVFERTALITAKVVKGKEEEGDKFKDYFDFQEPLRKCSSHRLLALRRGEAEGVLRVSIAPAEDEDCLNQLNRQFVRSNDVCGRLVSEAVADSYKRLLRPSIETEFAAGSRAKAEEEAIRVFAANLKQLLLSPPLGQKRVLGIDPGFRTGCKVVCLDNQGTLLHNEAIFPHPPRNEYAQAQRKLAQLVEQYNIEAIAIGNGTASRETERLVKSISFDREVQAFVVSEDGASVYSASKIARDEFPDYDVTVRGAVSIGRRLMDPLAELVKIDPKSIGVGQYQHDVDQTKLKKSLDGVVEFCVSSVGVNLNTASQHLLTYVAGVGPNLAQNIIDYRTENGAFRSRKDLMHVKRMGAKAFEQCAGFLRIPDATDPLDATAVHPERYALVRRMAADHKTTVEELIRNKALRESIDLKQYVTDDCGLPTLTDIMSELDKPGRDPRKAIEVFSFAPDVETIDDLKPGMILPGIVSNITNFGCFVDIGVHEKGLVHISEMADRYVSDPNTVVTLHQQLKVRVLSVDKARNRIALSLKNI